MNKTVILSPLQYQLILELLLTEEGKIERLEYGEVDDHLKHELIIINQLIQKLKD